jgi:hypothetical protein
VTHESPLPGQVLRSSPLDGYDAEEQKVADLASANIISSEVEGKPGVHKPVLDIDLGVKVIPSSTEGHFHLLIDKEMSWDDYQRLLWVLADVGIVEENYASASDERGYTAVRLPWVRKDDDACRCDDCLRMERTRQACGRGWVDQGPNGVPCDCDDCHLEPDGRSRAERLRDEQDVCNCPDCVPSPTHRFQGQRADLMIMDEVPLMPLNTSGVGTPEFVLTDQQREYLGAFADATERNEQVWENNSRPPAPRQPAVEGSQGTIRISWNGQQINIENPRRYGHSAT